MPLETAYIAVGANLAPERHVARAVRMLAAQVRLVGISPFYYSEPLCRPDQPRFLNGVLAIETELEPRELKERILRPIEAALGRRRTADRHAARPIDLDILLHGSRRLEEDDLVIPDPEIAERAFLAIPLLDLVPDIHVPGEPRRLAQVAAPGLGRALEPAREFTKRLVLELGPGRAHPPKLKKRSHRHGHREDR